MVSKKYFKTHLNKRNETKDLVLFVQYSDYSVKEWNVIKRKIVENGFSIARIKNTVMSKALIGGSFQKMSSSFHGSMAVISCSEEFSPLDLKDIMKIIEEQSKIECVCALLYGEIVFPGTLQKWSKLPEEVELYSSFVSLLNRPTQSLIKLQQKGINMVCSDLSKFNHGDQ